MRRLTAGLASLLFTTLGAHAASELPILNQFNLGKDFVGPLAQTGALPPDFELGLGFTLARTQFLFEISTPEAEFPTIPHITELIQTFNPVCYFLGAPASNPSDIRLLAVEFAGGELSLLRQADLPEVTDVNARLGLIEAPIAFPPDPSVLSGPPPPPILLVTSARDSRVWVYDLGGRDLSTGVTLRTSFPASQYDDLDQLLGGDPALARAPADMTANATDQGIYLGSTPTFPMEIVFGIFDSPRLVAAIDAESQPDPASGHVQENENWDARALVSNIASADAPNRQRTVPIHELIDSQMAISVPELVTETGNPSRSYLPVGAAIEIISSELGASMDSQFTEPVEDEEGNILQPGGFRIILRRVVGSRAYMIIREGGLVDGVYTALMDAPTPHDDFPEESIFGAEEITFLPEDPVRLFTNFNLTQRFPIRLQEIEVDFDGTIWLRAEAVTETTEDEEGNPQTKQVFPDLFHISDVGSSSAQVVFSGVKDPLNPYHRADMSNDNEVNVADHVALTNYLNTGSDPNLDPILFPRVDLDADDDFDRTDEEMMATASLSTDPPGTLDVSATMPITFNRLPASLTVQSPNIYDLELVDFDRDGDLDVTALVQNGLNADILFRRNDTLRELGSEISFSTEERREPLGIDARQMVWTDVNRDGLVDIAVINRTNTGVDGIMQIGFNVGPAAIGPNLSFTPFFNAGPTPLDIKAGSVDADDVADIVIGNDAPDNNLTIFFNRFPNGGLERAVRSFRDSPRAIRILPDILRNGGNEIALAIDTDSKLEFIGNNSGSLSVADTENSRAPPRDVVTGHFAAPPGSPGSSAPDQADVALISAPSGGMFGNNQVIQYFRHTGNESDPLERVADIAIAALGDAVDAEAGDFNLDGFDDVAVLGQRSSVAFYATNTLFLPFVEAASLGLAQIFPLDANSTDLELGDLDRDGDLDAVISDVGALTTNRIRIFRNNHVPLPD